MNSAYLSIFNLLADNKLDTVVINHIIKALKNLHFGQGFDILWTNNKYIPSIKEYKKMIFNKTGVLFNLILDLASYYGNKISKIDDKLIFEKIGYFFQIRDDLCDIIDSKYWEKKGFFEDLNEGNMSYPIILCLSDKREDYKNILNMLGKKNSFYEKKKALNILLKNNSIKDTIDILIKLKNEILEIDDRLLAFLDQIYIPCLELDKLLEYENTFSKKKLISISHEYNETL